MVTPPGIKLSNEGAFLLNRIQELEQKLEDFKTETMDLVNEDGKKIETLEKKTHFKWINNLHDLLVKIDVENILPDLQKQISELQQKASNPEWLDILILDLIKLQMTPLEETLQVLIKTLIGRMGLFIDDILKGLLEKLEAKPKRKVKNADSYRDKILTIKEPTEKESLDRQTDLHCYCCGNLVKQEPDCFCRGCFLDVQNPEDHTLVEKADLEWLFEICEEYLDWDSLYRNKLIKLKERYLKEKEDADEQ